MMEGDYGQEVKEQEVSTIGGEEDTDGGIGKTDVVASEHLTDGNRAEGVPYTPVFGMDVTTKPYPAGTDVGEADNPLKPGGRTAPGGSSVTMTAEEHEGNTEFKP